MSNVSIGLAFEKKVQAFLEGRGFTVMRTWKKLSMFPKKEKGRTVWISLTKRQDFFGCIDLIAFRAKTQATLFFQCTTGKGAPRRHKIEAMDWNIAAQHVFMIRRKPNKRDVVIRRYYGEGRIWCSDETINLNKKNDKETEKVLWHFGI